jgi:short-subunit dehydrogenase
MRRMKYPFVKSRTVLITGCSSGIGLATAHYLRRRGWTVIPTARKTEDLEMLKSQRFMPVELNIADSHSIRAAAAETLKLTGGTLGAIVNNAGYGQPGAIEDLSRDAMRAQFETNVFGLQELTNQFIPLFRKECYGRIVNVSSVLGRITMPFMGIYSASKYAVEAMSDALRIELTHSGVSVSIIEPGPITSKFRERAVTQGSELEQEKSHFAEGYRQQLSPNREYKRATDPFTQPPEAVAKKILHALESRRPKTRYPVTIPAYAGDFIARFIPDRLRDRMMRSRLGRPVK